MAGGGCAWWGARGGGGMCGGGLCVVGACMMGVCMAGGMYGQGACMVGGDMCGKHAWQGTCMAGKMATAAGTTHPTGMHSCSTYCKTIKDYQLCQWLFVQKKTTEFRVLE